METLLKEALSTEVLRPTHQSGGGGCISNGEAYFTDTGTVFVKSNKKPKARVMFDGEVASLKAIAATKTVHVPNPITVLDLPKGGACIVLEYLEMKGLRKFSRRLGESVAKMHLDNTRRQTKAEQLQSTVTQPKISAEAADEDDDQSLYVTQFGFHETTCCGYLPQDNTWCDDWLAFFSQQRLQHQISLLEKESGDRNALELWSRLQLKIPKYFQNIEVKPALLHGDLWGGNAAEISSGPVVFDPATFYGHHEYELAISGMFGGFSRSFFDAYHELIPKAEGFELRSKLYKLFHYLNHWNHFGSGYKGSSISIMESLLKSN